MGVAQFMDHNWWNSRDSCDTQDLAWLMAEQQKGQHLQTQGGWNLHWERGYSLWKTEYPLDIPWLCSVGKASCTIWQGRDREIRARLKGAWLSSTADPQAGLAGSREAFLSTRSSWCSICTELFHEGTGWLWGTEWAQTDCLANLFFLLNIFKIPLSSSLLSKVCSSCSASCKLLSRQSTTEECQCHCCHLLTHWDLECISLHGIFPH